MGRLRFLVPTYGRAELPTLDYLAGEDVTVQTQDRRDLKVIREAHPECKLFLDEGADRLSTNANNGLTHFPMGETVAIMDDDITHAIACDDGRRKRIAAREFRERLEALSTMMDERGADVAVCFPSNGMSFRDAGGAIVERKLGSGWVMLVRNGCVSFDESLTSCEDYELQLNVIAAGGNTLRDNGLAPCSKPRTRRNGAQQGGRGFYYEDDEHKTNVRTVVQRYWPLARYARNGTAIALDSRYV